MASATLVVLSLAGEVAAGVVGLPVGGGLVMSLPVGGWMIAMFQPAGREGRRWRLVDVISGG